MIHWDEHQSFDEFTVKMEGSRPGINLCPAWRGTENIDNYYKMGESNHLTPKELQARGIKQLDPGYFGKGMS